MFPCFGRTHQTSAHQTSAVLPPYELPSFPLEFQTTTPSMRFVLFLVKDGIKDEVFCHFGKLFSFPGSFQCTHVIKLLFGIVLCHINLILRSAS